MKRILALILAALMLTVLFAGCQSEPNIDDSDVFSDGGDATATSDADYITGNGKMIIGMTLFAPMNYYDNATNELIGFETEFAEAVCEKIGIEPEFVEINWDSKEIELNAKNIDCIWNGMTITDERKANMEISDPYMQNRQVMVVKSENLEKYTEGVIGASVVAEAGSAGEELATGDEFFKDAAFTPVDSMAKALMDVAAGTSDIAIVDYVTSIGSIGAGTDFENLVAVEAREFAPEQYGIAFRKGSDMATVVNNTIDELIADGTLDAIATKYKLQNLLIKE
ncbi:MAG: transporter substrate-binding domain-containing protein [Oscillospiraceae bacterium]|nr:transporter substrate-binding domain-containing protein [Oscillospiraceae bacterium]MBQ4544247.1 transporter substrate-binding domain-containing protein [Oscillospiraceae bacterium]MBQ6902431.1 transporter substrate-binding domain-containing protein [Oscillospiraceae bacterium]